MKKTSYATWTYIKIYTGRHISHIFIFKFFNRNTCCPPVRKAEIEYESFVATFLVASKAKGVIDWIITLY